MDQPLKYKIGVAGLWHLGEIYSACLAELGHEVIGFDDNEQVILNLKKAKPPLAEPELSAIIEKNIAVGRLSFDAVYEKIKDCDAVWLAYDTPVDENDNIDMRPIFDFFKNNCRYFKNDVLIIISSQVPVGTCGDIKKIIRNLRPDLDFDLAYVPENLQLGQAVKSFFEPGRIVVGVDKKEIGEKIKNIFSGLKTDFLMTSTASAEMTKHALNAFLASSLCFIYDIADLCQVCGADVVDVAKALRSDKRIGQVAYLDASIGFSGGTLARDLQILIQKGRELKTETPVISAVFFKNKSRRDLAISFLENTLGGLRDKKISVFGLTYKPGTSILRRALSLEIIARLKEKGARIEAYDPAAKKEEVEKEGVIFNEDPYACAKGSQAAIFITNWPEFKDLNFKKIREQMSNPSIFFDARNFFHDEAEALRRTGFLYLSIGN